VFRARRGWGVRWYEGDRRPQRTGFGSATAARRYFRDEIAPRLGLASGIDPNVTLGEFVDVYLDAHALNVEASSLVVLRDRLKRATATFGDTSLRDLERKAPEIAAWRATLAEGTRYGATQALRQCLEQAVRWGVLVRNPAKLAGANPQPKRSEIQPFTPAELEAIAAELGEAHRPIVTLATATGLMPSEWIALERRDVRHAERVLLVERSFSRGALKGYGKTSGRRRRVPLSGAALAALDAVPPRIDSRLVFPNEDGGHLDLHNWRRREWKPALEAACVEHGTIYTLRHNYATRSLAAGISLFELSRYMGTSIEMINRHYGHLAEGSEQAAAAKLDAYEAALADAPGGV
jgi:integrase